MLWLILACTGSTDDDGESDEPPAAETDAPVGPDDTDLPPPQDVDTDGYSDDVDCDDYNPAIFPGADELWNREDDDCDGYTDADGGYEGSVSMSAVAVYEGQPYSFSLSCPATLSRGGVQLAFSVVCTPDPADEMAQLLLGSNLTIQPKDTGIDGGAWSGAVTVYSEPGPGGSAWDSSGSGSLDWTSFGHTAIGISFSSFSLDFGASGSLARTGPATF